MTYIFGQHAHTEIIRDGMNSRMPTCTHGQFATPRIAVGVRVVPPRPEGDLIIAEHLESDHRGLLGVAGILQR